MATFLTHLVDGQAAGLWKAIHAEAAKHERAEITVEEYDPEHSISKQQLKWWWSQPVKLLADYTGYSAWEAERELKQTEFLERFFVVITRKGRALLSIRDITIRQMNDIIECCQTEMPKKFKIPLDAPNPDWNKYIQDKDAKAVVDLDKEILPGCPLPKASDDDGK